MRFSLQLEINNQSIIPAASTELLQEIAVYFTLHDTTSSEHSTESNLQVVQIFRRLLDVLLQCPHKLGQQLISILN